MPGYSSVDEGLIIDLSRMNQVTVDPEAKRARVQGGALLFAALGASLVRADPSVRVLIEGHSR